MATRRKTKSKGGKRRTMPKHSSLSPSLVFIILVYLLRKSNLEKLPVDLSDEKFDEIGKDFMSFLSEDLKSKLTNTTTGKPFDMDEIESANLTDKEKKEIEVALRKAFEPIMNQFVEMIAASGIPQDSVIFDKLGDEKPAKTKENENTNKKETENKKSVTNDEL